MIICFIYTSPRHCFTLRKCSRIIQCCILPLLRSVCFLPLIGFKSLLILTNLRQKGQIIAYANEITTDQNPWTIMCADNAIGTNCMITPKEEFPYLFSVLDIGHCKIKTIKPQQKDTTQWSIFFSKTSKKWKKEYYDK